MVIAYNQAVAEGVPMVDVQVRAERIKDALIELGCMSRITHGFSKSVHSKSGDRIWANYRSGTYNVLDNAERKVHNREDLVKVLLGSVAGYGVLRENRRGLMNLRRINAEARSDWESFLDSYRGVVNKDRRDDYRKAIGKQMTAQKRLRKRPKMAGLVETGRM